MTANSWPGSWITRSRSTRTATASSDVVNGIGPTVPDRLQQGADVGLALERGRDQARRVDAERPRGLPQRDDRFLRAAQTGPFQPPPLGPRRVGRTRRGDQVCGLGLSPQARHQARMSESDGLVRAPSMREDFDRAIPPLPLRRAASGRHQAGSPGGGRRSAAWHCSDR